MDEWCQTSFARVSAIDFYANKGSFRRMNDEQRKQKRKQIYSGEENEAERKENNQTKALTNNHPWTSFCSIWPNFRSFRPIQLRL